MEPLRRGIGTLVGVLLLAGCGGTTITPSADVAGGSAQVESGVETEAQSDTAARGRGVVVGEKALEDEDALRLFRENVAFVADAEDEEISELAESICTYWDSIPAENDVDAAAERQTSELRSRGMTEGDARSAPVFATAWKCPEHYRRTSVLD